jgi:hypothetical protein
MILVGRRTEVRPRPACSISDYQRAGALRHPASYHICVRLYSLVLARWLTANVRSCSHDASPVHSFDQWPLQEPQASYGRAGTIRGVVQFHVGDGERVNGSRMDDQRNNREGGGSVMSRPIWVRIGLWGIGSRGAALGFMWFSFIAAIACSAYGFYDPRFFAGGLLVLAGIWYWLCIRWTDEHDGWKE